MARELYSCVRRQILKRIKHKARIALYGLDVAMQQWMPDAYFGAPHNLEGSCEDP
ncbi:MAG TPA: hypothetical protein VHZ32_02505 [Rhizomicrobium sp.]|nr:hypothetical protein [Rhizomicrobium sp.]